MKLYKIIACYLIGLHSIKIKEIEIVEKNKIFVDKNNSRYRKADLDIISNYSVIRDSITIITLKKDMIPAHISTLQEYCFKQLNDIKVKCNNAIDYYLDFKYDESKIKKYI